MRRALRWWLMLLIPAVAAFVHAVTSVGDRLVGGGTYPGSRPVATPELHGRERSTAGPAADSIAPVVDPRREPARETRSIRVTCQAVLVDSGVPARELLAMPSDLQAIAVDQLECRELGRAVLDASGLGVLELSIPADSRSLFVSCSSVSAGCRALPFEVAITQDFHYQAPLLLQRAGRIRCRAVDHQGLPLRGAHFLLEEEIDRRFPPIPTWELVSYAASYRILGTDDAGQLDAVARAGPVRVALVAPDGVQHVPVSAMVAVGEVAELGDFTTGAPAGVYAVRVLDHEGRPVSRAWVHIADPSLAVGRGEGPQGVPTLLADEAGRVRIEHASADLGPVDVAVGSPQHEVVGVRLLPAEERTVVLQLRPCARVRVRVGGRPPDSEVSRLLLNGNWILSMDRKPSARPASGTRPSAVDALREFLQRDRLVEAPTGVPGDYAALGHVEGEATLSCTVPGGSRLSVGVIVSRSSQARIAALELPGSRVVRLLGEFQDGYAGVESRARLRLSWTSPDSGEARSWAVLLGELRDGCDILLPSQVQALSINPADELVGPWQSVDLALSPDVAELKFSLRVDAGAVPVEFRLRDGDADIALDDVAIWVIREESGGGPAREPGFTVHTSESGTCRTYVKPGSYRAVSLRRLREPPIWTSIRVTPAEETQALVRVR